MNEYIQVAAVLRIDPWWREFADDEVQNMITVVAVVPTPAEADDKVARLNAQTRGELGTSARTPVGIHRAELLTSPGHAA